MPVKTVCTVALLLLSVASAARPPALKTFHDAKYGVSFQYPAGWNAGSDISFYLGTEIQQQNPDGSLPDPIARVGFVVDEKNNEFARTNLNGVEFAYNVIPQIGPDDCRKRVQMLSEQPIGETTIHGVTFNHFSGADAGLGHQAAREIFSSFLQGRCYLFEEAIHTVSREDARPLDPVKLKNLRKQLHAVMQSVQIEGAR